MVNRFAFWCILLLLLSGCSGSDLETETKAPSVGLLLSMSGGIPSVIFEHSTHSSHTCDACHQCGVGDGKISFMSKDWAHITCKNCHTQVQQGPSSCKGCHKFTTSLKAVTSAVSVIQTGPVAFVVYGVELDGVARIQLEIAYDPAVLASPTITSESLIAGALLAANTSVPGVVRLDIAGAQSFAGSGPIAVINFASSAGVDSHVSIRSLEAAGIMDDPQPIAIEIASLNGTVYVPASSVSTPFFTTPDVTVSTGVPTSVVPIFVCK